MPEEGAFSAGYVLVQTGSHDVYSVRDRLLKVRGVRIADPLFGPDDLICYLETYAFDDFRIALDRGIRELIDEGVIERTETMVVLPEREDRLARTEERLRSGAWLLCDLSVGNPQPVIDELLEFEALGVVSAHPVLGRYDLVVRIKAASIVSLNRTLDEEIRQIKGIRRTDTRLVAIKPSDSSSSPA
jgi:DNA-binding Lrp family transcriptional regulator